MGRDLTELAAMLIGVSLVTLLVVHASSTVSIISAGTSGFNNLLSTVTGQNNGFGGSGF